MGGGGSKPNLRFKRSSDISLIIIYADNLVLLAKEEMLQDKTDSLIESGTSYGI
jgi:hypothetical protein